jgi:hypothetical protein
MFLPTLRAVAKALERDLEKPSVTELIIGTREAYLKRTTDYAVSPRKQLYALQGTAIHALNSENAGDMLSEQRLHDNITSGQFDLYGKLLNEQDGTLGDIKVTSSYKLMKALGIRKVDIPTGYIYKSGQKAGQEKTVKGFQYDGVRHLLEWAMQLNYYRILLEKSGLVVKRMIIQALCRDANARTASERGITKELYLIPIDKISDHWIGRYMRTKALSLANCLTNKELPPICRRKERWNDRKCQGYCDVASCCPYGQQWQAGDETNLPKAA